MKKFVASLLSLVLLLSFTACGSAETKQQENMQAGGQTEDSENKTEEAPDAEAEGNVEPGQAAGIDDGFILITGGTFQMGSPSTENWRSDDETQHMVAVSDFYMAPYEVTQAEYEEVVGSNPSSFPRRLNGSMPAARGQRHRFIWRIPQAQKKRTITDTILMKSRAITFRRRILQRNRESTGRPRWRWTAFHRIPGASIICTAM